jgi:hypothetical protein
MQCFNHPDRPALGICTRCQRGVCSECLRLVEDLLPAVLAMESRCGRQTRF